MKHDARRALLVASISLGTSGLVGLGALGGCDAGDAASPQNAANRDSGLGSAPDSGSVVIDAGTDGSVQDTGIVDAGPAAEGGPMLNGCTAYVDHRGGKNVNLVWSFNITSDPSHCSKIAVGSTVTWIAMPLSFGTHPLTASATGDTPNPIDSTNAIDSGGGGAPTVTITFARAGAFPYVCGVHPDMVGTIVVDGPADAGGD